MLFNQIGRRPCTFPNSHVSTSHANGRERETGLDRSSDHFGIEKVFAKPAGQSTAQLKRVFFTR